MSDDIEKHWFDVGTALDRRGRCKMEKSEAGDFLALGATTVHMEHSGTVCVGNRVILFSIDSAGCGVAYE